MPRLPKKPLKKSVPKAKRSPSAPRSKYSRVFGAQDRATISKAEFIRWLGNSPKIVDRMLHATRSGDPWVEIVGNRQGKGGARTMVDYESAQRAYKRWAGGEQPPLMPSERTKKAPPPLVGGKGTPTKQGETLMAALALTPLEADSVTFYPKKKMFGVQWSNGNYQWFRVSSGRGRRSKLYHVTFRPPRSVANIESLGSSDEEPQR
mgnify:CR=1 FL=1